MPQKLRRRVVAVTAAAVMACAGGAPAQTGSSEPTLRERLVFGLQARRPSEFDFIDAVVDSVERGDLPEKLVERFFFFARSRPQRRTRTRRPIIDFEFGLKVAAEKLGIEIRRDPPPS